MHTKISNIGIKKTYIFILTILLLISCNGNEINKNLQEKELGIDIEEENTHEEENTQEEKIKDKINKENIIKFDKNLERLNNFTYKSENFYNCINPTINSCIDREYLQLANDNKDEKYCELLNNDSSILECKKGIYLIEALSTGDVSKCDNLTGTGNIISCKNNINLSLSRAQNETSFCDKIIFNDDNLSFNNNEKQRCKNDIYLKNAKEKKDKSLCEKLEGENNALICEREIDFLLEMEKNQSKNEIQ